MVFLVAAVLIVGCSAGSAASTTSDHVTTSPNSAATGVSATASPAATTSPSAAASASLSLLGILPVPPGGTPWPANANALLSLVSYVQSIYIKRVWTPEEALYARRGFVSAVERGWNNADGTQQYIEVVRFATPIGATSAFDEQISDWKQQDMTKLTDPAVGGVGFSGPVLDSQGNAHVNFWATVGDTLIHVVEYAAATPDPAAAKALLQEQYDRIKNGLRRPLALARLGQFRHS